MSDQQKERIGITKKRSVWELEWDEWVTAGFQELERYLAKQAAFAEFLRARAEV